MQKTMMKTTKKPKAIELVFKAQPMMALLLEFMKRTTGGEDQFTRDVENWISDSREVLNRKAGKGKKDGDVVDV